ncbi:RtcB family protein, partial [Candidatus Woesearchaeota archaeon]|nr:RtcB family protein [Candidatus Woesearchaeota archaeon]
ELIATDDHPILTQNSLKLINEIEKNEKIAILGYEGVEYEEPSDKIIVDEKDIKIFGVSERVIENLKKRNLLPLRLNSELLPVLTKLLGFLTGDGWLGKNKDRLTLKFIGKPKDLEKIKEDIQKLGYLATGPYKCYAKSNITYTDNQKRIIEGTSYQIVVTSIGLPALFCALGAPIGNKSKKEFEVPSWIFKTTLWLKRLYLAGYFGAELSKPSNPKKEVYRFRSPLLSINKLEGLKGNGYKFLGGIKKLCDEFDIAIGGILELKGVITKSGERTVKLRLKISSKKDNLIKLWSKIGYEYCEDRTILASHALNYLDFENNCTKKESLLREKSINKLSITSQRFRHSDIIPFNDFVSSFKLNPPTPIMWDIIESKEEIKNYKGYVYDFTVQHKDHNFIADSFVTGNCGSRGLGHQLASDYIKLMEDEYGYKDLADRELINAPINSDLGEKYYKAMCAAVNYAFCNRQMIAHWTRDVFKKVMGTSEGMRQVYDQTHNTAKFEKHKIDGEFRKVCIHRKGASRSFGPGMEDLPEVYKKIGQPVLIPGTMGTSSYLLVGTNEAEDVSFSSTCHGAGRVMSRHQALRCKRGDQVVKDLALKGIEVKGVSMSGVAEEMPEAYKDIDEVIRVSHTLKIGNMVARLKPLAVMKG